MHSLYKNGPPNGPLNEQRASIQNKAGSISLSATAPFFVRVRPDSNGFDLHFISALLWHSHTITLYPKGNNVDSIDEIIEVQNVESSIGSRMATENDLALRSPLAILFG